MQTSFKAYSCLLILCFFCIFYITKTNAQTSTKLEKKIIYGGQFKDLFLPIPLDHALIDKHIWGSENVLPRDIKNGIEDSLWSYWGGNPIRGTDDNYHIAICRWKEDTGHWGWPKSEVAHAISKDPLGPYIVTGTIIEKGHNPEIISLKNGSFILHTSGAKVYTSKSLDSLWTYQGELAIDTQGYKGLSHLKTNLTGIEREDGSFLFFTKRGDVMISNKGILGPFKIVSAHNYNRYSGYPEDPVIWKSRHQYHVVYNHAIEKKSIHMRSLDGIHWIVEPGLAYDKTIFKYSDGTKNEWEKFERPKVIQDIYGRATHMSLGVIDVQKKFDLGKDNHSSKNTILPLVVEKLIEIENSKLTGDQNGSIKIRIKSEPDFNAVKEVDVNSLLLGTSNDVNYGKGVKPTKSYQDNTDVIIVFNNKGINIPTTHYDLKLLGKTKKGTLFFGYALLPEFNNEPASLVTTPIEIKKTTDQQTLCVTVENVGLKPSAKSKLKIFTHKQSSSKLLKTYNIPRLDSYESYKIEFPLKLESHVEYEATIVNKVSETSMWKKLDNTHKSIVFKGDWRGNTTGENIFMGSENTSHQVGASVIFNFKGTQAKCYGSISKKMGACDVYLDGKFIEEIDCFFGAAIYNTVIYKTPILEHGHHKLELKVNGKHFQKNELAPISIDAFSFMN